MGGLIEVDETAIGRRKYERGKRQRHGGVQWVQTMMPVTVDENGRRQPKELRAVMVDDRTKTTLQQNIKKNIQQGSEIQSDGWKGYRSLEETGSDHNVVKHNVSFVRKQAGRKITTNTLEGAHGVLKRKARQLNLFSGQGANKYLAQKVQELVFRYNKRDVKDLFPVFSYLLSAHYCISETQLADEMQKLRL